LKLEEAERMASGSTLIPASFPYLIAEDHALLAISENICDEDLLLLVGHQSNQAIVDQVNRFMKLYFYFRQNNIDKHIDIDAIIIRLMNILKTRRNANDVDYLIFDMK
jgi:hypothetical protein